MTGVYDSAGTRLGALMVSGGPIQLTEPWRDTVFCRVHGEIEHAGIDRDHAELHEAGGHALVAEALTRCGHRERIVTTALDPDDAFLGVDR